MSYDGYTKYDAAVAASYDADREQEEHWKAENQFVSVYAAANRLGSVLDIPVGTGRLLAPLRNAERIVGVDVSRDMLSEAAKATEGLQLKHVHLALGDALALEYADGEFDTVVCFRLLHLLPPELAPRLLEELARVCRGRVLLQIYAGTRPPRRGMRQIISRIGSLVRRLGGLQARRPWSHINSYTHTPEAVLGWVHSAGLRMIRRHSLCLYEGSSVEVLELSR